MSTNTIGEVNINLRMSTVQFAQDVKAGADANARAVTQIASDTRSNITEARGTIALLGEDIGIHLPRHLQTFIASIPGVGAALSAAFSSVAIVALIGIVVEIIQKITEFRAKAAELAKALKDAGEAGQQSIHKMDEQILALNERFDELTNNKAGALQLALKQINNTSLDALADQLKGIGKELDDLLSKQMNAWWLNLFAGDNAGVTQVKTQADAMLAVLTDLKNAGDQAGYGSALAGMLQSAQAGAQAQVGESKQVQQAWVAVSKELGVLQTEYKKTQLIAHDAARNDTIEAQKKALQDLTAAAAQAREALAAAYGKVTPPDTSAWDKINNDLDQALKDIDKFADANKTFWSEQDVQDYKEQLVNQARVNQLNLLINQMKQLTTLSQQRVTLLPPVINRPAPGVPSSGEAELESIQRNSAEAQSAARQTVDATETVNQKYEEQLAILAELYKQQLLTGNEYAIAVKQAGQEANKMSQEWSHVGESIGQTITQAALFGGSWTDAFKQITLQLVDLVLQMTLLKSLNTSSGGIGGFFDSIAQGLAGGPLKGHATGGPAIQGQSYVVGEHGPELFSPSMSGRIISNSDARGAAKPSSNVTVVQNITTPDANSFGKSQGQLLSDAYRQTQIQHSRLRGR